MSKKFSKLFGLFAVAVSVTAGCSALIDAKGNGIGAPCEITKPGVDPCRTDKGYFCTEVSDGFAALEALNCGKPINAMRNDEIPAIADCWRFFAGAIRSLHAPVAGEYLPGFTSMMPISVTKRTPPCCGGQAM